MATVLAKYTENRDNNFNLIRFIAASIVLYFHSFTLASGPGATEPLGHFIGMYLGSIAVDILFIQRDCLSLFKVILFDLPGAVVVYFQ